MGKTRDAALKKWLDAFGDTVSISTVDPRTRRTSRIPADSKALRELLSDGFRAGWGAALDIVEVMLSKGEMLMTADCIEDRHDDCAQEGSTDPRKVCGCPCHGQYTRKARR